MLLRFVLPISKKTNTTATKPPYAKILIICSEGIGNAVMALPALRTLRLSYPSANLFAWTTAKPIAELLQHTQLFQKIFLQKPGIKSYLFAFFKLRRMHFDVGLLCFPTFTLEYEIMPIIGKCKATVAHKYRHPYFHLIEKHFSHLFEIDETKHDVEQNFSMLRPLNIDLDPDTNLTFPNLQISKIPVPFAFESSGCGAKIMLHPGSKTGHLYKQWPIDRFIETADLIRQYQLGQAFFLIGPDETEFLHHLKQRPIPYVIPENIDQTLIMLKQSQCLVCNDSGVMHLGALIGIPMVVIWGATDPKRNGPWQANAIQHRLELPCQPCVRYNAFAGCTFGCPPFPCLDFSPEHVVDSIRGVLGIKKSEVK